MQVVERWILARLRNRVFFSLSELNSAIAQLLTEAQRRVRSNVARALAPVCSPSSSARPASTLPVKHYEFATWKKAKVHLDYHVEVERAYYSVPYPLIGKTVEVRLSAHTLEIYHRSSWWPRIFAARAKASSPPLDAHRPERHARCWT